MKFSYFNGKVNDKKPTKDIAIGELVDMIKNNENKNTIQALRLMNKKDIGYRALKSVLPSVCIHGSFNYLSTDGLNQLSGLMYFDIDAEIGNDVDDFIKRFVEKNKNIVSVCGKSVGGKGIFFYIKLAQSELLTVANFKAVQKHVGENFFGEYVLDANACKLTQPNFISYDENVYYNPSASLMIDENIFLGKSNNQKSENNKNRCKERGVVSNTTTTQIQYHTSFTSKQYIFTPTPKEQFWQHIVWKTFVPVIDDVLDVKEREVFDLTFIERVQIKDGQKHAWFPTIVYTFRKLNPKFQIGEVLSFMYWVNATRTNKEPMDSKKLHDLTVFHFNAYDEQKLKGRIKKYHFSPLCKWNGSDKRNYVLHLNAKSKSDASFKKVKAAMNQMVLENIEVNISSVSRFSGISRPTVRKYFDELVNDLDAVQSTGEAEPINQQEAVIEPLADELYYEPSKEAEPTQEPMFESFTDRFLEKVIGDVNIFSKEYFVDQYGVDDEMALEMYEYQFELANAA